MDEQDEELAQRLRAQIEAGGRATAFGDEGTPADGDDDAQELDFMRVMNAYRAAKASGDRDRTAQAEQALQAFVRGELSERGC